MAQNVAPIFTKFHHSLVQVHTELRNGAAKVDHTVRHQLPASDVAAAILPFCEELLNHHKSEDSFFFPGIRRASRLRSSDIAFLDARDAEHKPIHALCESLLLLGKSIEAEMIVTEERSHRVMAIVRELSQISLPHFQAEETTLTPEHMRTLISEQQLADVYRDMGLHWNQR